ncbi:MAG: hypothetical protein N3F09_08865 [Bacteroidia bacterium]|nr:hypothetical protein [Bacteroidia bacterium]
MKKLDFTALLVAAVFFTSCNQRLIDFTVISSKNVTLRLPDDAKGPRTQGKDMRMCTQPMLKAAVDKAIENAGQGYDALIDGVIYQRNEIFRVGWVVEGTPIKTSKLKSSN